MLVCRLIEDDFSIADYPRASVIPDYPPFPSQGIAGSGNEIA